MITININKRPPKLIHSVSKESSVVGGHIDTEIQRRDGIITKLAQEFLKVFSIGDKVVIKGRPQFGKELTISNVVKGYHQFGKEEKWPKTDYPLIVSLYNSDDNTIVTCTTNSLEKV